MSQPTTDTKEYSAQREVWLHGHRITPGTVLALTKRQARYLLRSGAITPKGATPKSTAKPPPAKASASTPAQDK